MEKRLFIVMALAAVLACPLMAGTTFKWMGTEFTSLGTLYLTQVDDGTTGGPFVINTGSGPAINGLKVWCVEYGITFVPGQSYDYTIDHVAYSGNVGVSGDPLSNVTQYIYAKYLAGGYTQADWTEINQAIWFAEDEGGANNTVYQNALAAVGGTIKDAPDAWVLNLWTLEKQQDGTYCAIDKQSHTYVPAPGAIMLASMGMGLVGWLRRRQAL